LGLLKLEWSTLKPKGPDPEKVKTLLMRTHGVRRKEILKDENTSVHKFFEKYPMLKRSTFVSHNSALNLYNAYAKLEFELTMQRHDLKDEFNEELVIWCKVIVSYCKMTCTKSSAI